jgi:hypothetical protein
MSKPLIDKKRKIIYVHPSKCMGKSIEHVLFGFAHGGKSNHRLLRAYPQDKIEKFFTFSFIRNPWSRYVSGLSDYGSRIDPKNYSIDNIKKHLEADLKYPEKTGTKTMVWLNGNDVSGGMKSYHEFFTDHNGAYAMDWVGRMENSEEDWKNLCEKLGIDKKLPTINKRRKDRPHYSTFYDDEAKEMLQELYAWDIEFFGYEFEDKR